MTSATLKHAGHLLANGHFSAFYRKVKTRVFRALGLTPVQSWSFPKAASDGFTRNLDDVRASVHGEYFDIHRNRYLGTYEMFRDVLSKSNSVLEMAAPGAFSMALKKQFPAMSVTSSGTADLRYELPYANESFDAILSMEVIEHLKDRDSKNIDEIAMFTASGISSNLSEAHRLLRPGGYFLLTTPNPHSLDVLFRWLRGHALYNYPPHVREICREELMQHTGPFFELIAYRDSDFYFPFDADARREATKVLERSGIVPKNCGDTQLCIFRKKKWEK